MLLWLALLGLAGGGTGSYFAYGEHTRWGVVGITVGSAAAGIAAAFFTAYLLHWIFLAPRRQRDDALRAVDGLQAALDERTDRRKNISVEFEYDGDLLVFVNNRGPSLEDARINLFVPKLDGLTAERLTDDGTQVVPTGSHSEVGGSLVQGIDGAFRWSELHVYLPGANTTWGMRFRIGRIRVPTEIHFGITADALGDWIEWKPTIHPREGDESYWDEADDDEDAE